MILAVPGIEDNFLTLTLFLQNLSNALANGAVYALMALTVVMIYKTTGHLNFAQGEMAMFTTFLVFVLAVEHGFPVWLAIVIVVLVAMFVGAAFERILIQPLESRSVLAPVILTLGLLFILNGSAATIWGTQPRTPIPAPFPGGLDDKIDIITDRVPNFFITYKALGVWVSVGLLVLLINLLLQRTKLGLGYRAVAANAESALIVGIPVKRMLMLGWALAAGHRRDRRGHHRPVPQRPRLQLHGGRAAVRLRRRLPRRVRLHQGRGGRRAAGRDHRDVRAGALHVRRQRAVAGHGAARDPHRPVLPTSGPLRSANGWNGYDAVPGRHPARARRPTGRSRPWAGSCSSPRVPLRHQRRARTSSPSAGPRASPSPWPSSASTSSPATRARSRSATRSSSASAPTRP